ncbi:hypothetical protein AHiyo6_00310 [Arthrobacter sp. Hiyo6]|nr:hypothetical protein AHiyo6_00310 [Arthrobacter sp. Hiyo6]
MKGRTISTDPQQPDTPIEGAQEQTATAEKMPQGSYIDTGMQPLAAAGFRWNSKTQSLVLAFILLLSAVAITATAVAGHMEQAASVRAASLQAPSSDDKPSDWLSAWGTALGAVGTTGALWLGAVTFRRQVRDQHRGQAAAVSLRIIKQDIRLQRDIAEVINGGPFPIYNVEVTGRDQDWEDLKGVFKDGHNGDVVVDQLPVYYTYGKLRMGFVDFTDSAGTRWRRWAQGGLAELKRNADGSEVFHLEG